jgi:hypothetical protein
LAPAKHAGTTTEFAVAVLLMLCFEKSISIMHIHIKSGQQYELVLLLTILCRPAAVVM